MGVVSAYQLGRPERGIESAAVEMRVVLLVELLLGLACQEPEDMHTPTCTNLAWNVTYNAVI